MTTQYNPGHTLTRKTSANVEEYRFVTAAGAQAGAGAAAIGVSLTGAAAGGSITVATSGSVPVIAGATIAVGDQLASDAQGRAVPAASGNVILSVALEVATVGQDTEVLLGAPAATKGGA
ncbi:capsid cement protein [Paenibacillus tyrfis]|uniref:capsid cement protein n=1 Tax=Paenibacillus tyrfis TaxID=1501230 RepID=UPI000690529D|nr:capsid cement protein [Paenibacillus tyrfis]